MTPDLLAVLQQWPATRHGADVRRVGNRHSFSGAEIWRVGADGREFALRLWQEGMDDRRLRQIHSFQRRVAALGPSVIPALETTAGSEAILAMNGRSWELASWVPGEADDSATPSPARIAAAMRILAAIHNAAVLQPSLSWETSRDLSWDWIHSLDGSKAVKRMANESPSLHSRRDKLAEIITGELDPLRRRILQRQPGAERDLAESAISVVGALAPKARHDASVCAATPLPLQPRLGDARREHFLFTGDEVTGVVDFGAVDVDSPAGDVARLLGGFAGDDRERWTVGLAAYEDVHPLTDDERSAALVFDSTGTVIAAFNWVRWLFDERHALAPAVAREAALERLGQLTARLKTLAEWGGRSSC